ncbi:MAG: single-stranded-DNA-specific exonuclease RecJ [Agarilytica sp.]
MKLTVKRRPHAQNYQHLANDPNAVDTILKDIFASRGADYEKQRDYALKHMLRPEQLKGLPEALDLLLHALRNKEKILIVGDFDCDGATSTAVAVKCLHMFGHSNVDYLVPNRFIYGYGLTTEIVEVAKEFRPDLIITVDNGISSVDGVLAAKQGGINVLITDHHLPGKELPEANAIVNPNQPGCNFPSKNLAGVGVIFYLMSALRKVLRDQNWFEEKALQEPSMGAVLDLVALGTVADVVPLDYNNRILVAAGIKKIRAGQACPGIAALIQIAGKNFQNLSSTDFGFALGPRLNAAGRLDDMSHGIQCLLSNNFNQALQGAQDLDDLNKDRKQIEASMKQEALQQLETLSEEELKKQESGVCLFHPEWHQGVVGILASRIKEKLHRPTIVFAKTDNGEIKGSGRSIEGVHLRDVLDEVATLNPGLINKFGGHAMAAGLSIPLEKLPQFKQSFNSVVARYLTEENSEPVLLADGELPESLMNVEFAHTLKDISPWGQHFPEPLFSGEFTIVSQRIVGSNHLKLVLGMGEYSGNVVDAIAFNVDLDKWPNEQANKVSIVYSLDVNEFRGRESVQLLVRDIKAIAV